MYSGLLTSGFDKSVLFCQGISLPLLLKETVREVSIKNKPKIIRKKFFQEGGKPVKGKIKTSKPTMKTILFLFIPLEAGRDQRELIIELIIKIRPFHFKTPNDYT